MQGRAGRAARKDAVCETPQQGRSLGEMEVEGETAAPVGVSLLCDHLKHKEHLSLVLLWSVSLVLEVSHLNIFL